MGVMRTLVTGGAGFVGSHLCDALVRRGHHVLCLDNFLTGSPHNIAHLVGHPRFELVEHDITSPFEADVHRIYNLACPASPVQYQRDPIRTTKISVLGALHVLGLAKRCGAVVLQASTSEVYGEPEVHPQKETYRGHVDALGPRACYDEGKRCAESLFMDYQRRHGVRVKVARIFNTYGPRMRNDDGRVVSNFITQALSNRPITLYGEGLQTRAFCYVDDLVRGLIALMESAPSFVGPVNLGNPHEVTVRELAERILRMTRSPSPIEYAALPRDDPSRRCPDISLALRALDWTPHISLEQGLRKTIDDFAQRAALAVPLWSSAKTPSEAEP
ncbi:MAG TPA: UDP-glucuronic acid decarboxylase family protein [Burkholderiaceae bacterium]|nr:UDP-glucuronic acid decarboxylase family protein [Burkholderiaceae bacterium]